MDDDAAAPRWAQDPVRVQAQLLEAVGQAVMAIDRGGDVVYWNAAAEVVFGWKATEVVGRPVADIAGLITDAQQDLEEERREALRRDGAWSGESERRRRDGSAFVAMVTDSLYYDETGRPAGVMSISTDISDRIAAERHAHALLAPPGDVDELEAWMQRRR
ncbi:MAG TPA: PAS domain S-box protein [Acidimicrobiales bacterium]|nr:PAS domain S-box protein [Acidimicrobiales bacterium]